MSYTGGSNEYAVTYLKDRADTLQKESEDAEAKLERYMRNRNLVSLDNSMDLVSSTMMTLQKALDEAEIDKIRLNATAKEIESYRGTGGDLTEIRYIAQHGNVPALRNQLDDLRRRPQSPEIEAQAAAVQRGLDQEISRAVADLKAEVREQQEVVNDLAAQKDAAENKEFDLLALKTNYNSLVTQRDVAKRNYMNILDRLNQTQTSKNLQNVPLHPLDTAMAPSGP